MRYFSQNNPLWKNDKLGSTNLSVGDYGCTTSCICTGGTWFGETITPKELASIHTLYTPTGLVIWNQIGKIFEKMEFLYRYYSFNENLVDEYVVKNPDTVVLLNVNNKKHWVFALKKTASGYLCSDPYQFPAKNNVYARTNIDGFAVLKKKLKIMDKVLDISHWQTVKDWAKVAKETKCVILKATQGTSYIDPTFYKYRVAARNEGLLVGAYHFADGNDVEKECDHFVETVGTMLEGEFLVLDYEIHLADPLNWCGKFLNRCEIRTGIRPLLYINTSTYKSYKWQKENLWLASYGANDGKEHPIPYPCVMHQYTSRGSVGGIDGYVDWSVGDVDELKKLGKILTPEPSKIPKPINTPPEPQAATVDPNLNAQSIPVEQTPTKEQDLWQAALLEIWILIKKFFNILTK